MKYCIKCDNPIEEDNKEVKWLMMITKLGQKIVAFECFHAGCWKDFWGDSIKIARKS